jgi:hypothetical protein
MRGPNATRLWEQTVAPVGIDWTETKKRWHWRRRSQEVSRLGLRVLGLRVLGRSGASGGGQGSLGWEPEGKAVWRLPTPQTLLCNTSFPLHPQSLKEDPSWKGENGGLGGWRSAGSREGVSTQDNKPFPEGQPLSFPSGLPDNSNLTFTSQQENRKHLWGNQEERPKALTSAFLH